MCVLRLRAISAICDRTRSELSVSACADVLPGRCWQFSGTRVVAGRVGESLSPPGHRQSGVGCAAMVGARRSVLRSIAVGAVVLLPVVDRRACRQVIDWNCARWGPWSGSGSCATCSYCRGCGANLMHVMAGWLFVCVAACFRLAFGFVACWSWVCVGCVVWRARAPWRHALSARARVTLGGGMCRLRRCRRVACLIAFRCRVSGRQLQLWCCGVGICRSSWRLREFALRFCGASRCRSRRRQTPAWRPSFYSVGGFFWVHFLVSFLSPEPCPPTVGGHTLWPRFWARMWPPFRGPPAAAGGRGARVSVASL